MEVTDKDTVFYKRIEYQTTLKEGRVGIHLNNEDVIFGQYKANKKHGSWEYYNKKQELYKKEYYTEDFLSRVEFYKKGKKIKEVITDPAF